MRASENDPPGFSGQSSRDGLFRRLQFPLSVLPQFGPADHGRAGTADCGRTVRVLKAAGQRPRWGVLFRRRTDPVAGGTGPADALRQGTGLSGKAGHQRLPAAGTEGTLRPGTGGLRRHGYQGGALALRAGMRDNARAGAGGTGRRQSPCPRSGTSQRRSSDPHSGTGRREPNGPRNVASR